MKKYNFLLLTFLSLIFLTSGTLFSVRAQTLTQEDSCRSGFIDAVSTSSGHYCVAIFCGSTTDPNITCASTGRVTYNRDTFNSDHLPQERYCNDWTEGSPNIQKIGPNLPPCSATTAAPVQSQPTSQTPQQNTAPTQTQTHISQNTGNIHVPSADFNQFDPLQIGGSSDITHPSASSVAAQLQDPGSIISRALLFLFPAAGLILFVMIVWGGFEILSGATTPKSKDAGRQRITAAVIGFMLLFVSYWIIQVVQFVFGVRILN